MKIQQKKDESPFHIHKKTALQCNSSMEEWVFLFIFLHFQLCIIYHCISEYWMKKWKNKNRANWMSNLTKINFGSL